MKNQKKKRGLVFVSKDGSVSIFMWITELGKPRFIKYIWRTFLGKAEIQLWSNSLKRWLHQEFIHLGMVIENERRQPNL